MNREGEGIKGGPTYRICELDKGEVIVEGLLFKVRPQENLPHQPEDRPEVRGLFQLWYRKLEAPFNFDTGSERLISTLIPEVRGCFQLWYRKWEMVKHIYFEPCRSKDLKSKETGCKMLNSAVVPDTGSGRLKEYLIPEVNAGAYLRTKFRVRIQVLYRNAELIGISWTDL